MGDPKVSHTRLERLAPLSGLWMTGHRPLNPRCGKRAYPSSPDASSEHLAPPRPTARFSKIGGSEENRTPIFRVQTGRSPVELRTQKFVHSLFWVRVREWRLAPPCVGRLLNPRPGARTPGLGWREGETDIGGTTGNCTRTFSLRTRRTPVIRWPHGTGGSCTLVSSMPNWRPPVGRRPLDLYGAHGRSRTSHSCMSRRRYTDYLRGHGRGDWTRTSDFLPPRQAGWPLPYAPKFVIGSPARPRT